MAGAPIGNTNSSKANRMWADTLRKIAVQNPDRMRKIAEKVFSNAEDGDINAVREIGDRLDGKAIQQNDVNVKGSLTTILSGIGRDRASESDNPEVA
jgi:hypothetical protein